MLGSGGLFATGATLAIPGMGGKATESLMEDAPCSYLLPSRDLSLLLGASKRGGYTTLCECFNRLQIHAVTPICSSMNLHNDSYLPCLLEGHTKAEGKCIRTRRYFLRRASLTRNGARSKTLGSLQVMPRHRCCSCLRECRKLKQLATTQKQLQRATPNPGRLPRGARGISPGPVANRGLPLDTHKVAGGVFWGGLVGA